MDSYLSFKIHGVIMLLTGSTIGGLGFLVFFKNRANKTNQAFFKFCLGTFIYLISFAFLNFVNKTEDARIWLFTSYIFGIPFLPIPTYELGAYIRGEKPNQKFLIFGYTTACIATVWLYFILPRGIAFKERWWGRFPLWWETPQGIIHYFFVVTLFVTYAVFSISNFYRAWKEAPTKLEATRRRNLFIAFFVVYAAAWDFVSSAGLMNAYPIGYIPLLTFAVLTSYNLIQYQVMDVRIVFWRATTIILIYLGLTTLIIPLAWFYLEKTSGVNQQQLLTVIVVGIGSGLIFSFGPFFYAHFIKNTYWLKGHTTTGLAHELKSPLNVIQSIADILSEPTISAEKRSAYIDMIKKNAARMDDYVHDLLNLAKTHEETITLQKSEIDFTELVTNVCEMNFEIIRSKGLSFDTHITPGLILFGDGAKLRQSVSNLISNAIKFTHKGFIRVEALNIKGQITVKITDSGLGLDKKNLKKIFDRFYQAKTNIKGSGIGLTIAKAWVEAHDGNIWAESEGEGKGTTVIFTLPV